MFSLAQLFGLGIANICGSFFSSYPATGKIFLSQTLDEYGSKEVEEQ